MKKVSVILLLLIFFSCKKQKDISANGVVLDSGDPAADGCSWIIRINGTNEEYHPDILTDQFKQNNLPVQVNYTLTPNYFTCGWGARLRIIHILSIQR